MAEIKDKIVTAESLLALHNYAEDNYVKDTGRQIIAGEKTFSGNTQFNSQIFVGDDFVIKEDTSGNAILIGGGTNPTTLSFGNSGLDVDGTISQNGTAVSLSNHTHDYLPLSGGTIRGHLKVNGYLDVNTGIVGLYGAGDTASNPPRLEFWYDTYYDNYTSRITESSAGTLSVDGNLNINGDLIANGTKLNDHTHSKLIYDEYAMVRLTKDGDYYYFRPTLMNFICGSNNYPWYKVYTENLKVTNGKPVFEYIGAYGQGSTTTYAANMYVGTTGIVSRYSSSSSKTIKHDIKELQDEQIKADRLYDLDVVQFKYNEDILSEDDQRYLTDICGFIIEDMVEKYPIAVDKPEDDVKTWSWNIHYLVPPMLKLIQDQKKQIDEQQKEINILKEKVGI